MEQFAFPFQKSLTGLQPAAIQALINAAKATALQSATTGSALKAGAALLLTDGRILTAAGKHDAALPAGICAEQAVLKDYHTDGNIKILAIAVARHPAKDNGKAPLAPCGACRQAILEAQLRQQHPITIYMTNPAGEVLFVEDAKYLLPFSEDNL